MPLLLRKKVGSSFTFTFLSIVAFDEIVTLLVLNFAGL